MQNLLNTYNEKLDKLQAEHATAMSRERETHQNNDEITKIYWNTAKGLLVAKMEICQQVISDIESEIAK
ncbi:hypothetical protein ACE193_21710 [Bernardetia sp. OM2101]|uniref:hypothetical protein n=1 Tax=Bernardetia sp. OM2101 TaxID=3344876 RepID=UPI0035CFF582